MGRGLRNISSIRDLKLEGKVVFLRLDLNVPIAKGVIQDDNRIRASLPTIQYAMEHGATLVLASHLGRPKGPGDKENSLEPVATRLSELLNVEVILVEEPGSDVVKALLAGLKKGQLLLLENLRYHPGETENSEEFARALGKFCDVYVNDAFGASHRAHASIQMLPTLMKEKAMGFLIEKEIQFLDQLTEQPQKPYLAILGGSKVSDKLGVIEKLIDLVDGFIVGGAMAYTFLKAKNLSIGASRFEQDRVSFAREMMARLELRGKKLLLPVDHRVVRHLTDSNCEVTSAESIPEGMLGVDIGPRTAELFSKEISRAKTLFWNGPMGIFERPEFSSGTFVVAKALAENPGVKVVGGGDSAAAVEASGYADQMTHISTGGGASLEYLQGDLLPGLEALRPRKTS